MCKAAKSCFLLVIPLGLFTLQALAESPGAPNAVLYVDDSATGANDGSSWTDAFVDLQLALDAGEIVDQDVEIRVARGLYRPSKLIDPLDPRSATFQLYPGLQLIGGFAGQSDPFARNWEAHPTVFSGDLLANDEVLYPQLADNSYHVVSRDQSEGMVVIDGFIVRDGNADREFDNQGGGLYARGLITLRNCEFIQNHGGTNVSNAEGSVATFGDGGGAVAFLISSNQTPRPTVTISNCGFGGNSGSTVGGAVYTSANNVDFYFDHCLFSGTNALHGGGVFLAGLNTTVTFEAVEFRQNFAHEGGGAIDGSNQNIDLVIQNSFFQQNEGYRGGAVYSVNKSVRILGSRFSYNRAEWTGGGAVAVNSAVIEDCLFEYNVARTGGGLYVEKAEVAGCIFTNNAATFGGGAYDEGGTHFRSSSFLANLADVIGGGVYASGDPAGGSINDCFFAVNRAEFGGGAYLLGHATPYIVNRCQFLHHSSSIGGGAYVIDSPVEVAFRNSLFVDNHADYGGGLAGGANNFSLTGCTVVNNTATTLGGGVSGGGGASITNSILWGNAVGENFPQTQEDQAEAFQFLNVNYSVVQGWTGEFNGTANTGADPEFVDPFSDFRLLSGSIGRNAGNPTFVPLIDDADLDGHARVLCGAVDMGAYESGFGDADCDGQVNAWDFAVWVACAEGKVQGAACESMDSDVDGDFDLKDFAAVQNGW